MLFLGVGPVHPQVSARLYCEVPSNIIFGINRLTHFSSRRPHPFFHQPVRQDPSSAPLNNKPESATVRNARIILEHCFVIFHTKACIFVKQQPSSLLRKPPWVSQERGKKKTNAIFCVGKQKQYFIKQMK